MRIALISDLHANELALEATVRDVRRVGVDRVVCLGDVATLGPHPEATLQMLRDLRCRCVLGNHDDYLLRPELVRSYTEAPFIVAAIDWCRARISRDAMDFVRTFESGLDLELEPGVSLRLFHGTPRSHSEDLLCTTAPETVREMLGDARPAVMAGGHTHVQMMRRYRGTLVVNPGSVGMPFREYVGGGPPELLPWAEYAVVECERGAVRVSLNRVPLGKKALRSAAEAAPADHPMRAMLMQQYA